MLRRSFIAAAVAAALPQAGAARAVIVPPLMLRLWGDGIHDDTAAMQALLDRHGYVPPGRYYFTRLVAPRG